MSQQAHAGPGWYPVPGGVKWWDGQRWVGATQSPPMTVEKPARMRKRTLRVVAWVAAAWLAIVFLNIIYTLVGKLT